MKELRGCKNVFLLQWREALMRPTNNGSKINCAERHALRSKNCAYHHSCQDKF